MAFFLFECEPSIPMDAIVLCKEQLKRAIIPPHDFFMYSGTAGDYGIKVSVILNDNESLASLYDNVKKITNETHPEVTPFKAESVILKPGLFKRIFGG